MPPTPYSLEATACCPVTLGALGSLGHSPYLSPNNVLIPLDMPISLSIRSHGLPAPPPYDRITIATCSVDSIYFYVLFHQIHGVCPLPSL